MEDETAKEASAGGGVIGVVALVLVGGGLFVAFGMMGGDSVARVAMTTQPQTVTFDVEEGGTLQIWANLQITHRDFSPSIAAVKLPHVMDYVIELRAPGGKTAQTRCNPFNTNFMRFSDEYNSIGEDAGRAYDGLIRGCAFDVGPGAHSLVVHVEAVKPDPRVSLQKNELIARLD